MTHANNHLPLAFEDWILNGSPGAIRRESLQRRLVNVDHAAALVTQVMTHVAVPVNVGDIITNVSFASGATAAGTPTNWWFAVYNSAGTLLAQTADQLTAAWAADTVKTLALATPQTVTVDGFVYAACMVKATTVPSLVGVSVVRAAVSTGFISGQVRLAGNSGSALTGTAPGTIATPTAQTQVPYAVLT
jgi:hypothetical protein